MNIKPEKKIQYYLYTIIFMTILYYIICFCTHGKYFDSVFFGDHNDTFADFFKCVYGWHGNPFEENIGNYPAIAMIFFKLVYHMIPLDIYVENGLMYRAESAVWIVFILYNIVTVWISWISISKVSKLSSANKKTLGLVLAISMPVMFAFERGNQINLAFALTMFFVAYYDDERKLVKEAALVSLALAASLKLYPAVYGFILIKEKKGKEICRLGIYGICTFFLPFLYYGRTAFKSFVMCLLGFSEGRIAYAYNFSLKNIVKTLGHVCGIYVPEALCNKIWIIILLFLMVVIFIEKNGWKLWCALTLLLIWVPSVSDTYVLLFMIIPFIMLLNEVNMGKKENTEYFSMLCYWILFVPLALPQIERELGYILSYSYLVYFASVLCLGCQIIVCSIKDIKGKSDKMSVLEIHGNS